jgi:hypothetical protein
MINLPTITLCAVSSVRIDETLHALEKSMRGITFAKVLFLTDKEVSNPHQGITIIPIETLDYNQYSHFIIYKLKDYIDTDFVLIVQHDGYVLHPTKWSDEFLQYDYIGAPWPRDRFSDTDGTNVRVGNGGFSLRSKKLLELPSTLVLPFTDNGTGYFHEDGFVCLYHRKELIENGVKFAPVSVASRFSRERWCSDSVMRPFGFHNNRRGIKMIKKLIHKLFSI